MALYLHDMMIAQMQLALKLDVPLDKDWKSEAVQKTIATMTIAAADECFEVLRHFRWKPWQNAEDKPADLAAVKEEVIDILHFVLEMCLLCGMDDQSVYEEYMRKNKINLARAETRK